MRKLLLILAALALAGTLDFARAETPERVLPEDGTISLGIGQSETLRFRSPIQTINVVTQGIVQASAQSDHVITLFGQAQGDTYVFIMGSSGERVFSARVIVTAEPGHVVRLYGGGGDNVRDYTGFYCTDVACGRADKELGGARDVTSRTITSPQGFTTTRTFGR